MYNSLHTDINVIIFDIIQNSDESNVYKEMRVLKELTKILVLVAQYKYAEAASALFKLPLSDDGKAVFTDMLRKQIAQVSGECAANAKHVAYK